MTLWHQHHGTIWSSLPKTGKKLDLLVLKVFSNTTESIILQNDTARASTASMPAAQLTFVARLLVGARSISWKIRLKNTLKNIPSIPLHKAESHTYIYCWLLSPRMFLRIAQGWDSSLSSMPLKTAYTQHSFGYSLAAVDKANYPVLRAMVHCQTINNNDNK